WSTLVSTWEARRVKSVSARLMGRSSANGAGARIDSSASCRIFGTPPYINDDVDRRGEAATRTPEPLFPATRGARPLVSRLDLMLRAARETAHCKSLCLL